MDDTQSSYDDHDSIDSAPTDGLVATIRRAFNRHLTTWADRYVEMRVEARTGRRD